MGYVQQQLLEKLMDLMKEKSMEVNDDGSSNLDRNSFKFLHKLEFPSFDGTHPRNSVKKCFRYFVLCKIPESQRVDVASIHFTRKAETWFASYIAVKKQVDWSDFIVDVCSCFKEELGSKVVEDFLKLQQWGSVEAYLGKFEELKSLMLQRTPVLSNDYFIASFIAGLKPHLKPFVKALNPLTLDDAIHFAWLQEEVAEAFRLNRPPAVNRPPLLPTPGGS